MPLTPAPSRTAIEIVIPDCCNIGVIVRALLAVNMAALTGSLLHAATFKTGVAAFVESAIVVELATLSSLPSAAAWCLAALAVGEALSDGHTPGDATDLR